MIALSIITAAVATGVESKPDIPADETRKVVHEYGECIVKHNQRRASAAILANADNAELMRKYGSLIDGKCLGRPSVAVEARFKGDQYRYALADALVRKELASMAAPDLTGVPQLDHRDPGEPPAAVDKKGKPLKQKDYQEALERYRIAQGYTYLSRYGECVVRSNPGAARALLLTKPESADEKQQFNALANALSVCVPEGETMSFGKLALRGTVAVNYYRLAKAAQPAPAVGGMR